MDTYIVTGPHEVSLASGRSVAPGELLTTKDLDLDVDDNGDGGIDTRLVAERVLIDVRHDNSAPKAAKPATDDKEK